MCVSGCGLLYRPEMSLKEITCPCGRGYWDLFQARFVSGDQIRAGEAPPREDYEAQVKKEFKDADQYEAQMRAQYITHFLDCDVKHGRDEELRKAGHTDRSTYHRSIVEIQEILRGDFRSRGSSASGLSESSALLQGVSGQPSERSLPSQSGPRTPSLMGSFLKADQFSLQVIKHHQLQRTFGHWTDIQELEEGGAPGYRIQYAPKTTPLTDEDLKRLRDESAALLTAETKGKAISRD